MLFRSDLWSEKKVAEAVESIVGQGIRTISIADTIGAADAELIHRVVAAVLHDGGDCEVGVHMHTKREEAAAKVIAAYDAGCRRFDAAIGGLGGCPFAQDQLIGNVPTEEVLRALKQRGLDLSIERQLPVIAAMNAAISDEFLADAAAAD